MKNKMIIHNTKIDIRFVAIILLFFTIQDKILHKLF